MEISPQSIIEILSLRYDSNHSPKLPKLSWKDFLPSENYSDEQIEKIIKEYLHSTLSNNKEKKISIALSGGIDSTLTLLYLKKFLPDWEITAFSIKFADSTDETIQASKITEHFGVDHKVIFLKNYLEELPKAISIIKQPFWDLHWYYVVKEAQTFSKILASGDGGDELFGGYTFRYKKYLSLINSSSTPIEKSTAYLQCHERDHVPDQESLFGQNIPFSWGKIHTKLSHWFDNSLPELTQVFLADYNGKLLYNFSPINSKINNHFGITSVTPILSPKLTHYACKIHQNKKYDFQNNIGKIPLRNLLKKHGVEHLISNEKLGFSVNTSNLWKSIGHELCKSYLINSNIVKSKLINKEWIQKHIDRDNLDTRYVNKFLGLLALEIWYQLFISKEIDDSITL